MNTYREHIEAAVQATAFHSPSIFSWFGKRIQQLPVRIRRALSPKTARDYLVATLQDHLYADFYCKGFASPIKGNVNRPQSPLGITPLVEELSQANSGVGYWENGWLVRAIEGGSVLVFKAGLTLRVRPKDCLIPQGDPIAPNMRLSVRFPKEFPGISPGFYVATSNIALTPDDWQQMVRFYWNLSPKGAVRFMQNATLALNQANLPFRLKVLKDLARSTRCDAVVLYARQGDYDWICQILEKIYSKVIVDLRRGTPVFTKPVAAGIGLAEEPGQRTSFGMHRCRILAEGMICAYEQGKRTVDERLQVVLQHFSQEGVDLEKPFLNPGSEDRYNFRFGLRRQVQLSSQIETATDIKLAPDTLLQTAYEIGRCLCQQAVWYQDRCNWMGAAPGPDNRTYSALGPELYAGTSGVGLFLAELYTSTGDITMAHTALGAIHQALSSVDTVPDTTRLGHYSGWIGIALAAARIGIILQKEALLERAEQLLQAAMRNHQAGSELDLISGNAGAIAALMVLRNALDDPSLLDFAGQLGEELLETAVEFKDGYAWKTVNASNEYHLTGFSHGAAGIGYALLELFHATGHPRYRRAAELAFNYERYWFEADAGNWPDLREEPIRSNRSKYPLSFSTFWCHGAPGIALSRLRAYEILKDERYKTEALTALQTTQAMIEKTLYSGTTNFSLCHGLAGNAEVLLIGSQVLGLEFPTGVEVAKAGIRMYASHEHQWPCGTGGATPSLMLGLAGIGYFYLRLHNPAIPSVLILQHDRSETI